MDEYFPPPPDYIITHEDVLRQPFFCTALLTLTMISFWRSSPAPPWLVCNKACVDQVHPCTAR